MSSYHSPLADCTAAIDNADNINLNSRHRTGKKAGHSTSQVSKDVVSLLTQAVVSRNNRSDATTAPNANRILPFESATTCRTAFTAARPKPLKPIVHRHNPYRPVLCESPMTPAEGFLAVYSPLVADQRHTVNRTDVSAAIDTEVVSYAGTRTATPASPMQHLQQQTTPTEIRSPPMVSQTHPSGEGSPTRVVKIVVAGGIDRSSGRPIPRRSSN